MFDSAIARLLFSRVGDVLGVLLSGPLADLCKRWMLAYVAIGITTLLSFPTPLAILHKRIPLLMLLQFLITFFGLGLLHGLANPDLGKFSDEVQVFGRWPML